MRHATCYLLALMSVSALGACSSPPTYLYLIEDSDKAPQSIHSVQDKTIINLSKIELPAYAQDERVLRKSQNHSITADDNHRWAEPPDQSLTRVLSTKLSRKMDVVTMVDPLPRGVNPSYRVVVSVDVFLLNETADAEFSGHVTLMSGDGRETLRILPFSLETQSKSLAAGDYATAIEENLEALSDFIATALDLSA